jgi:succinoglycan biosynthesis transport protein ExoP
MLLEENEKPLDLDNLKAIFLRRRVLFVRWALPAMLLTFLVALALPPTYRSTASILIEQQEIPQDLVRSTITSYADQRIQVITQRVMTSTNLLQIIDKFDLYAEERRQEPLEFIFEAMRKDIGTEMVSADVIDPRSGRPVEATIALSGELR